MKRAVGVSMYRSRHSATFYLRQPARRTQQEALGSSSLQCPIDVPMLYAEASSDGIQNRSARSTTTADFDWESLAAASSLRRVAERGKMSCGCVEERNTSSRCGEPDIAT